MITIFPAFLCTFFTSVITSGYALRQTCLFGNTEPSEEQNSVCAGELQEEALQAQAGLWRSPLEYALISGNAFTVCRHESMLTHEPNKAFSLECLMYSPYAVQSNGLRRRTFMGQVWFYMMRLFSQQSAAVRFWASNIGQARTTLSITYLSPMEMLFLLQHGNAQGHKASGITAFLSLLNLTALRRPPTSTPSNLLDEVMRQPWARTSHNQWGPY